MARSVKTTSNPRSKNVPNVGPQGRMRPSGRRGREASRSASVSTLDDDVPLSELSSGRMTSPDAPSLSAGNENIGHHYGRNSRLSGNGNGNGNGNGGADEANDDRPLAAVEREAWEGPKTSPRLMPSQIQGQAPAGVDPGVSSSARDTPTPGLRSQNRANTPHPRGLQADYQEQGHQSYDGDEQMTDGNPSEPVSGLRADTSSMTNNAVVPAIGAPVEQHPNTSPSDIISVHVRDPHGHPITFRCRPTTPLYKLLENYALRYDLDLNTIRFISPTGCRLDKHDRVSRLRGEQCSRLKFSRFLPSWSALDILPFETGRGTQRLIPEKYPLLLTPQHRLPTRADRLPKSNQISTSNMTITSSLHTVEEILLG
ncbi:hypothetical protein BCV70DRAFT_208851 [Testicularia cyperi]|uniref:Rad60/SUMO-like domain-containing protein n=1 Tax=Testicularia cyperi TaxID=1882483 RepID=A0A317XFG1_9BASI|nr:hypothetical protein BCV70DRAFT_208851 [Testicularia cyperi]